MAVTEQFENHLKSITSKVPLEYGADPIDAFDIINRRLKNNSQVNDPLRLDQAQVSKQDKHIAGITTLFKPPANTEDGEPLKLCSVPNIQDELNIIRATGFGLPLEESFLLSASLRKLAAEATGMSSVRLWGKVLCRSNCDYIIAEGQPESPEEAPEGSDEDGLGKGINTHAYYATTDYTTWSRLPSIAPSHIKASRLVKYILTGNLQAAVETFPLFPGTEAHLLRCQIARISASTVLAPRGFFTLDEDAVVKTEEFKYPLSSNVLTPDDWVYARDYILANGKTTYPPIPEDEEDPIARETRVKLKREMRSDPVPKPLGSISKNSRKWTIRQYGDCVVSAGPTSHGIAVVRSKEWPGAMNFFEGSRFLHFYCGYGLKATSSKYFIAPPADIQGEGEELEEQTEPHLLPPPVVVEEVATAN